MATAQVNLRTTADIAAIQKMDAAFQDLSKAEQKAAQQAIQTAQAFARLDAATGNPTQGAARLRATLDGLGAGPARQVAGVEAQITKLGSATQQGTTYAQQFGDAFKSGLVGIVGPAAAAAGALAALKGAVDLAQVGAQAETTRVRFDQLAKQANTTGDAMLAALKKASGGTIADTALELDAMKASLLGVAKNADELSPLLAIARDRAQQMGISVEFAFDSLVTGLGRGSRLILDNIGVIVKVEEVNAAYAKSVHKTVAELTEEEKKQALVNEVLRQGNETIAKTGGAVETTATKQERLSAAWENAKTKLGGLLATASVGFVEGTGDLLGVLDRTPESFGKAAVSMNNFGRAIQGLPALTKAEEDAVRNAAASTVEFTDKLTGTKTATDAYAGSSERGGLAADRAAAASQGLTVAVDEELQKKVAAQIETARLTQSQAQLSADSALAAQGLLGAGDQAVILAQKYGIATGQAQSLINAQQALGNATALANQRIGEQTGTTATADQSQFFAEQDRLKAQRQAPINAAALGDQRIGERTGTTQTAKTFTAISELERKATQTRVAEQKSAADKAAGEARRIADAQFSLNLNKAITNEQKIAVVRQQLAKTTDQAERINLESQIVSLQQAKTRGGAGGKGIAAADRADLALSGLSEEGDAVDQLQARLDFVNQKLAQGNLTALQRKQYTEEQLKLEIKIGDAIEKQNDAVLDARLASVKDARARLDEANRTKAAQNVLGSGEFSAEQKARAALALQEVNLEQQQRAREIAKKVTTGGTGGGFSADEVDQAQTLLRTRLGAGGPIAFGPLGAPFTGGPPPAGATTAATGGAEQVGVINIDGKQVGVVLLPHLLAALRSGRAQVAAAGG